jgi:hypothetical protein
MISLTSSLKLVFCFSRIRQSIEKKISENLFPKKLTIIDESIGHSRGK